MVAYSFKERFVAPIQCGEKRQTIRSDRKRHARPGEMLQLYTGMRTKRCSLIGEAQCEGIEPVSLDLVHWAVFLYQRGQIWLTSERDLNEFARLDGFADWVEMRNFFREEHPGKKVFAGLLISWGALDANAP